MKVMFYIHINRNIIQQNAKAIAENRPQDVQPPIRFQDGKYGESIYCYRLAFTAGEILYSADKALLPCGAKLVIQTADKPEILD
jgi:hypothetical protein